MSGAHHGGDVVRAFSARAMESPRGAARLPAGLKLGLALAIVAGTTLMPVAWISWHIIVFLLLVSAVLLGRLPLLPLLKRLLWFSPFVLGAALAATLEGPQGPGWRAVALRGALCLLTMLVLAATTPFAAIIDVLRRLRIPALLITTLTLMHRYLFVLTDEAKRMRRARASRTLIAVRRLEWRLSADVVGRLFLRASERAERIYLAMCARGWR